jgi:DNA-binding transcriptional ArsR family regulator
MALPSFTQHLAVLEDVGMVASRKEGRVRTYRLTPRPLQSAEDWMTAQHRLWERRLDRFDEYVQALKEKGS